MPPGPTPTEQPRAGFEPASRLPRTTDRMAASAVPCRPAATNASAGSCACATCRSVPGPHSSLMDRCTSAKLVGASEGWHGSASRSSYATCHEHVVGVDS
jgi:hypothetical protein